MQNKIKFLILQVLNQNVKNGYTVLELDEIFSALPQDNLLQDNELKKILYTLKDEGYIDIKYMDSNSCCVNIFQKGRVQAQALSSESVTKENNIVDASKKTLSIIKANKQTLFLHLSASFLGGLLAGLFTFFSVLMIR